MAFDERRWLVPFPLDARLTLSVHQRGGGDPAYRVDAAGAVWRTSLTPGGPGMRSVPARARSPAPGRGRPAGPGARERAG